MTTPSSLLKKTRAAAFSKTELLVTLAVLGLLTVAILLPALAKVKRRSPLISCTMNLKQIDLSFRLWAGDKNDLLPMQVAVTNGGTRELLATGLVYPHFQAISKWNQKNAKNNGFWHIRE